EGAELDILGPLGHGWSIRPTVRNLLLIGEDELVVALPLLAQVALEQKLVVTLLCKSRTVEGAYPPALLPPEVEYQIVTDDLVSALEHYLNWADAACCGVSRETSLVLYNRFERIRGKHFAQALLLQPLSCGTGVCLTCNVETRTGQKLICRDGPIFD